MRRHGGARRPLSSKPETCTERRDIDPTGISVTNSPGANLRASREAVRRMDAPNNVGASYPGRSAWVPRATSALPTSKGVGKLMQKSAEAIVGVSTNRRAEH
jgi:hypothetical protein